ncbi:hypothetical protein LK996_00710 [Lysobacter sp. A6]|uniref:DUF1376 domain-containing protein n=1 Tax=Noviluteimonas lactosilytica TaxID=2888523 RepID=A0ABS8JDB3_9GAMM|nr:hypothetical protein [Lysobacter lactosilyticus]MCC8361604.1 hypothetical protein [Lysobacter lactosilyticus]
MATEHWFRWHHGTVNDPKWQAVAARAGRTLSRKVTVGHVVAVWAAMLECASQATPRGSIATWVDEDVAAGLDMDEAEVCAIREAMAGKTHAGGALTAWKTRQPVREDASAMERKRVQRERERRDEGSVTHGHESSRAVTLEEKREEEIRKKQEQELCASPTGSRLPTDWSLPDDWREWAQAERPELDIGVEGERFADYWRGIAGAKGRKADWLATWRNWIRNANAPRGMRGAVSGDVFAGAQ